MTALRASANPDFFGLLHVASSVAKPVNFRSSGDPIDIYIRCASLCALSFSAQGYPFRLVTNQSERVEERIRALGLPHLTIEPYDFGWDVPEEAAFYSAHFKLELIDAFGRGRFGDHVALVDLDTVLLRPFDERLLSASALVGYELTRSEARDYGASTLASAVSILAETPLPPCWWGGEFLMGRSEDFAALSAYIARVWPRYLTSWRYAHHQGDEALISTAIALMRRDGIPVVDAGSARGIHRWWSARTLSRHPGLETALQNSLIHLPADKDFLASFPANDRFDADTFAAAYRKTARRKVWSRRLVGLVRRMQRERPRKYAPSLK